MRIALCDSARRREVLKPVLQPRRGPHRFREIRSAHVADRITLPSLQERAVPVYLPQVRHPEQSEATRDKGIGGRRERRQEPSRSRAYLSSSCQQSADRLAPHHAGLDHRTTLPTTVPPPWQTPGAQQCPVAAALVAQALPTACCQQQLMHNRKKRDVPFFCTWPLHIATTP